MVVNSATSQTPHPNVSDLAPSWWDPTPDQPEPAVQPWIYVISADAACCYKRRTLRGLRVLRTLMVRAELLNRLRRHMGRADSCEPKEPRTGWRCTLTPSGEYD